MILMTIKEYKYWLNKPEWHHKLLFECFAETIEVADALFSEATGLDLMRDAYIGCDVTADYD